MGRGYLNDRWVIDTAVLTHDNVQVFKIDGGTVVGYGNDDAKQ